MPAGREEYFDREGRPISPQQYMKLARSKRYPIVDGTLVHSANNKPFFVSTIWLGYDQTMGFAPKPLIFGTQVFDVLKVEGSTLTLAPSAPNPQDPTASELPFDYYEDEFDALAGHLHIVDYVKETEL